MKVLILFVDMIRPNRLSLINSSIKKKTPFDETIEKLGGTLYTNCFSPGPDTPRSISSFFTGIDPYLNGCNTRLKWPYNFLDANQPTILDLFKDHSYDIHCFSSLNERDNGFFPPNSESRCIFNETPDLDSFLNSFKLSESHLLFFALPDFHWAFDDWGYNIVSEVNAYKVLCSSINKIFDKFNKDCFDHILMFSDHGFKFTREFKTENKMLLLNSDRTNVFLLHRKKSCENIYFNNNLVSISDFYSEFQYLVSNHALDYTFFPKSNRSFVVSEDHLNFLPQVNQNIELWSVTTLENIYIRTLSSAITVSRLTNKVVSSSFVENFDLILRNHSSFSWYNDEYSKLSLYRKNIRVVSSTYSNNLPRRSLSRLQKYLLTLIDFFLTLFNRH